MLKRESPPSRDPLLREKKKRGMMTIQMGTLSQTRSLLFSCLLTALVVYTLSTRFSSPPRGFVPTSGYSPELGRPYAEDEEVIPHGISVFKPDGYKKHLVLPRMSNEDVSWLTYLPPEMMITPKPYIVDADLRNPPVGAMTTPINKVRHRYILKLFNKC